MSYRPASTTTNVLIGLVIAAAVVAAVVAMVRIDTWGERAAQRRKEALDPLALEKIDPALIRYQQTAEIAVPVDAPRAIAVGPDDRIYVAGDRAVAVLASDGIKRAEITLDAEPQCLAVGGAEHAHPGRIYVGFEDHVEVFDAEGRRVAAWPSLGEKALLTSVAVAEDDVFVADAGNLIVLRFDTEGTLNSRIGEPDELRKIPGFVITGRYFDLAVAPDGLLRVVNPRLLRIEAYTFDGHLEAFWGESSPTIAGFFGCCNPAHIAILPDGHVVTVEKGFPRVKIYSSTGKFEGVVAGPEQLGLRGDAQPPDVAVDGQERVLVLEPTSKSIRVFQLRPEERE